jgi:ATP-dependent helicase HrpA
LRLPVEPIARASADQRKGRCGRVGPGVCIRLYSEEDFLAREPFTAPELLRTNLANVILQMKALGLGEIAQFPFLETPSPRLVAEGLETLAELGAVDRRGNLTALGKRMTTLPVDPRLARTVLAAIDEGALAEGLVIAAALSIQDPRERPAGQGGAADFAQLIFRDQESDFLSLLKLWRRWRSESAALGSSALRRWCREHFISHQRMREWSELHEQLRSMVSERLGTRAAPLADQCDANRIHRAMLAGFVSQLGFRGEDGEYRTATGGRFAIFPGSTLARRTPNWVVAAEIVETSRRFGRTLARVQGDWVERIAPHLVERIRSEPHWVRATGQVAAWERVQFGELTIVPRRRVPWGPVQPEDARNIFIQCALVDGDCELDAPFIKHSLTRAFPPTCTAFHHLNGGGAAWNRAIAERSLCESRTCLPVLRMQTCPCDSLTPLTLVAERLQSCAMNCRPAPPLMEFTRALRSATWAQQPPTVWSGSSLDCLQKRSRHSYARCPSACGFDSFHCVKLPRQRQNRSHLQKVQFLSLLQRTLPK